VCQGNFLNDCTFHAFFSISLRIQQIWQKKQYPYHHPAKKGKNNKTIYFAHGYILEEIQENIKKQENPKFITTLPPAARGVSKRE
jgi:hypothetical protein